MRNESECELSECLAALCQKVGRFHSLRVDWLVKPGEQKGTTKTGLFARSDQKRGKPACGAHLALLSTGGQSFGTKRPIILTNGKLTPMLSSTTIGQPPKPLERRTAKRSGWKCTAQWTGNFRASPS